MRIRKSYLHRSIYHGLVWTAIIIEFDTYRNRPIEKRKIPFGTIDELFRQKRMETTVNISEVS